VPEPGERLVVLADHDPQWALDFEQDRGEIEAVMGGYALGVDHVGSTSVPGLAAKPIIDILLQVPDSADEPSYVPPLLGLGYRVRVREPDWLEHRVLSRRVEHGDAHSVNVHVLSRQHGAGEIARMLGFRDWLRTHDDDRDRYEAVKRDLATRDWRVVQDYADAKTDVVEQILARVAQDRR
jgi:GrpB-like predicted nucleotidyltransferase (UPF0157 family)